MPQDITPNNDQQSATTTNTMSPKNISAQSAGSITPTIISQSNADRRRRANNERERRSRQNLGANVERSEIEREYRRLREAEEAANRRAEARKAAANRETVTFYAGGVNTPLEVKRVSIGEYLGSKLRGASDPVATPDELNQYMAINGSGESGDFDSAYKGLDRLRQGVNALLEREAEEKTLIENVRISANLSGASASRAPSYTPMTAEAIEAHVRLINDKNTSAEMKAQLQADLNRDIAHAESTGRTVNLTQAAEKNLSENWYRGGTKEQKEIAGKYLAAAGSTYGKADFNKSADSIYASQAGKQRAALEKRWGEWSSNELKQTGIDAKTRSAIRTNQTLAGQAVSAIDTARLKAVSSGDQSSSFAAYNAEKQRQQAVAEKNFEKQNKAIQEKINGNSRYVNSILRVSNGNQLDLSQEAFFREQKVTEKIYGSDWTSAGGKTAADAIAKGKRTTSYSEFKAAPGFADEEYILVDREGKQRYTLRKGNTGGAFAVYSWSGDIVASGQNSKGLAGALKELNVPFDEKNFNAFRPETAAQKVYLESETDISGINTAAALKASILGTSRSNETVLQADSERRTAEARQKEIADAVGRKAALNDLDAAMMSEVGYTLRIGNTNNAFNIGNLESTAPAGIYVKDNAADNSVVMGSDLTVVRNREVDDFYNSVTGAVDAFKAKVPGPSLNELVFGSSKGKKETRKETKKDTDFVFENRDSFLSDLAKSFENIGNDFEKTLNEGNQIFEKYTGIELITTKYNDQKLTLADYLYGISDPRSGQLYGQLGGRKAIETIATIQNTDALELQPIELDHIIKLKRTASRQISESPKTAAGLLKIADSIHSSWEKGGSDAAIAAGTFWANQVAEGSIASALHDPEGFLLDLEAGALFGTTLSAATRPIYLAAKAPVKTAVLKTGEATGIVNTKVYSKTDWGMGKIPYEQVSRLDSARSVLTPGTITATHVQKDPLGSVLLGKGKLTFNRSTHGDTNDLIGGQSKHQLFASVNSFEDVYRMGGDRVTLPASVNLFTHKGLSRINKNTIVILEDIPKIGNYLSSEQLIKINKYLEGNDSIPDDFMLELYHTAQDAANLTGKPIATISPKTLHFAGGHTKPNSSISFDAENEVILVPPTKPQFLNQKLSFSNGVLNKKIYMPLPNRRFVGFDSNGVKIEKVSFADNAKKGHQFNPFFFVENAKETWGDLKLSKKTGLPYYKSRANYDATLSTLKALRNKGVIPTTPLDELAYSAHGKEHAFNVTSNMLTLQAGSLNPEIQNLRKNLLVAMGDWHDSFKIGDPEMFIPHAKRTNFLMREGFFDGVLKSEWGLNDQEIKIATRAIGRHTDIKPNIINKAIYRPTAADKLLATADRLDLTRFGTKVNPKKLFLNDVLNEPWSWSSGQLSPPAPRKGYYHIDDMTTPYEDAFEKDLIRISNIKDPLERKAAQKAANTKFRLALQKEINNNLDRDIAEIAKEFSNPKDPEYLFEKDLIETMKIKNPEERRAAKKAAKDRWKLAIKNEIDKDIAESVKFPNANEADLAIGDMIVASVKKDKEAKKAAKDRFKFTIQKDINKNIHSNKFDKYLGETHGGKHFKSSYFVKREPSTQITAGALLGSIGMSSKYKDNVSKYYTNKDTSKKTAKNNYKKYYSNTNSESMRNLSAGALLGSIGMSSQKKNAENYIKATKKDKPYNNSKKKEQSYYKKETEKGQYYKKKDGYSYGYSRTYKRKYPQKYTYIMKERKPTEYKPMKYLRKYEMNPRKYMSNYLKKGYLNPGTYQMGDKYGKPYGSKTASYNRMGNLLKTTTPNTLNKLRSKSKDHKSKNMKLKLNVYNIENTEIPIVRGEEALFGKRLPVLKKPANKRTIYDFGKVVIFTKPTIKKKKKRGKRNL